MPDSDPSREEQIQVALFSLYAFIKAFQTAVAATVLSREPPDIPALAEKIAIGNPGVLPELRETCIRITAITAVLDSYLSDIRKSCLSIRDKPNQARSTLGDAAAGATNNVMQSKEYKSLLTFYHGVKGEKEELEKKNADLLKQSADYAAKLEPSAYAALEKKKNAEIKMLEEENAQLLGDRDDNFNALMLAKASNEELEREIVQLKKDVADARAKSGNALALRRCLASQPGGIAGNAPKPPRKRKFSDDGDDDGDTCPQCKHRKTAA